MLPGPNLDLNGAQKTDEAKTFAELIHCHISSLQETAKLQKLHTETQNFLHLFLCPAYFKPSIFHTQHMF